MTAALRKTPTQANGGSDDGITYTDAVDLEIRTLWQTTFGWLTGIAGAANAITANSDTAQVAAIAAYVRPMGFYFVPVLGNTSAVTINIDGVGAVALKDKAGAALQGGEFGAGSVYPLVFDGTDMRALTVVAGAAENISNLPSYIAQDQKSSGVDGGTFTSGAWQTRTLNTEVRANISGASLASNEITLPAGNYYAEWSCPALGALRNQSRLRNKTDNTVLNYGSTEFSAGVGDATIRSVGSAYFTITSAKAIVLEHRSSGSSGTIGFGQSAGFGNVEVYSEIRIWKS